jgi:hypothetical protein
MGNRKIKTYFENLLDKLMLDYETSKGANEHSRVLGDVRETFIQNFLKNSLPKMVDVIQSAEIIDKEDKLSGEVDLSIYNPYVPKIPMSGKQSLLFNDYVVAALEIKTDLDGAELDKSINKSEKVKSLKRDLCIKVERPEGKLEQVSTPFFVIGFEGLQLSNINGHIEGKDCIDLPEIIINLKRQEALIKNDGFLYPYEKDLGKCYFYEINKHLLICIYQYLNLLIEAIKLNHYEGNLDVNQYLN